MKTRTALGCSLWLVPAFMSISSVARAEAPTDEVAPREPESSLPQTQPATFANAPAGAEKPTSSHWYGWQTLSIDGAVLATGLLPIIPKTSSPTANTTIAITWVSAYALGAPIVHWAHGQVGKGFGSMGMRVVGPFAGVFLGAGVGFLTGADFGARDSNGNALYTSTGETLMAAGFLAGFLTPMVIDAAVLAREPVKPQLSARTGLKGFQLSAAPTLLRGGAGLSAGGLF